MWATVELRCGEERSQRKKTKKDKMMTKTNLTQDQPTNPNINSPLIKLPVKSIIHKIISQIIEMQNNRRISNDF